MIESNSKKGIKKSVKRFVYDNVSEVACNRDTLLGLKRSAYFPGLSVMLIGPESAGG